MLRLRDRRLFYRSRLLRELAAVAHWSRRREAPDVAHLTFYDELTWGPFSATRHCSYTGS